VGILFKSAKVIIVINLKMNQIGKYYIAVRSTLRSEITQIREIVQI